MKRSTSLSSEFRGELEGEIHGVKSIAGSLPLTDPYRGGSRGQTGDDGEEDNEML
jgi:hypothetical protein